MYTGHDVRIAENRMSKVQEESGKSVKNVELWQMPYDNSSIFNGENDQRIILRSHQLIKEG